MAGDPCLTILVLTEDGADTAHETVTLLLKKTFPLLVPGTGTHRIGFHPQSDREHKIMHGNGWKSRTMRELVDLRRTIASRILEDEGGVPGFVVFHFDGDRRWSERLTGENEALFEERVREPVRQIVRDTLARFARETELDRRIRRLIAMVPFYSIESWLFRNVEGVRQRCCGRTAHAEAIHDWQADPAALDEVERPKKVLDCIESEHNATLAKGFPAEDALRGGASYEATLARMLDSSDLLVALENTTRRG